MNFEQSNLFVEYKKDVGGLDDSEEDFVYISHKSNLENVVMLNLNSACISIFIKTIIDSDQTILNNKDNPIIINIEDEYSFLFVMRYLDSYKNSKELDAPEIPLKNDIKMELELEYNIFKDLIEIDSNDTIAIQNNFRIIAKIINLADYMDIKNLYTKLAAIMASFLKKLSLNQIKLLNEV
jgi:hypothetical protein